MLLKIEKDGVLSLTGLGFFVLEGSDAVFKRF